MRVGIAVLLVLYLGLGVYAWRRAVTEHETQLVQRVARWRVVDYAHNLFRNKTLSEVRTSCHVARVSRRPRPVWARVSPHDSKELPRSHDPRSSPCRREVRDQGQCSGSWAIAVADALGDRFCKAGRTEAEDLSPQHLLSCSERNYGCGGGYVAAAFVFAEHSGLVTESCFPYLAQRGHSPECISRCINGRDWTPHKCLHGSIHELSYDIPTMKKELVNEGSLAMSMVVYQDFMYYLDGVYKHAYGTELGRHAVRCVGYGQDEGEDYWVCANSWGPLWGSNGWFKIAFNEADIEGDVWSCTPELARN